MHLNRSKTDTDRGLQAADVVLLTYCFLGVDKVLLERVHLLEKHVSPNMPLVPSAAQCLLPVILSRAILLPFSQPAPRTFDWPLAHKHVSKV